MILPGHLAAGYITTFALTTALGYSFTPTEQTLLLSAGTLLGDGPDLDVFFIFLKKKTTDISSLRNHRDYITHFPLLWLALGLIVYGIGASFASEFWKTLGLLLWICPWIHLVCDSIFTDTGVRWLAPFNQKQFMILKRNISEFPPNWSNLFLLCAKNPLYYLELVMVVLALVVFFNN